MIPKTCKFPMRTEFLAFRKRAQRHAARLCTMYYVPSTGQSRMSVIVPKKLSKLAVTRNWLKRLTYDTLWPPIKDKNHDVVVIYKPLKLEKSPQTKAQVIRELSSLKFE